MIDRQDLYEITLILKEGSSVSEAEKVLAQIAQIKKTTDLQVKQFAYPIGKLTSGHYFAVEFIASGDKLKKIETELKAEKSIIRSLITKAIRRSPEPVRTGEYAKKPEKPETEKKNTFVRIENTEKPKVEVKTETKEAINLAEPIAKEVKAKTETVVEEPKKQEAPTSETVGTPDKNVGAVGVPTGSSDQSVGESVGKAKIEEPKVEVKTEEKLVPKKPRLSVKRPKAEKVSAAELDKKLEELVKE